MKNFKEILAKGSVECDSKEEAFRKLSELSRNDEEFIFNHSEGWEKISLSSASIIEVSDGEDITEAKKIIDGKVNTNWTTNNYYSKPEVVLDLGEIKEVSKIILFNRHTRNRGTGGGNNALKTLELSYSNENGSDFKSFGQYNLDGPKPVCAKIKSGGQICTFIDDTTPNIIEIPKTLLRYLKIRFIEAFWEDDIPDDWKDSFSLTTFELYK
ncbi:MAG: discoidin domain-containing protein [Candidatus Delongbacteria bacterium]|nr:discoidin domain-containing protein [Candidatus Delongbacteria bacterium]